VQADKRYKVAGWAPVAEEARTMPGTKPVWDVVETWLKSQPGGRVTPRQLNTPRITGAAGNLGSAT
jgi:sulfur-oxidizing protein SoxB